MSASPSAGSPGPAECAPTPDLTERAPTPDLAEVLTRLASKGYNVTISPLDRDDEADERVRIHIEDGDDVEGELRWSLTFDRYSADRVLPALAAHPHAC